MKGKSRATKQKPIARLNVTAARESGSNWWDWKGENGEEFCDLRVFFVLPRGVKEVTLLVFAKPDPQSYRTYVPTWAMDSARDSASKPGDWYFHENYNAEACFYYSFVAWLNKTLWDKGITEVWIGVEA